MRTSIPQFLTLAVVVALARSGALQAQTDHNFRERVVPVLSEYCFPCHADGAEEGSMSFDTLLQEPDRHRQNEQWHRVLRQLQGGLMPPAGEDRPSAAQLAEIEKWIKYGAFGLDPDNPDPGRVTIRRLNRVEYQNTIRDLLGVDFDAEAAFPADDTGHGFDNIADVLSLSPLMLEKYVDAAKQIVDSRVPQVPGVVRVVTVPGSAFRLVGPNEATDTRSPSRSRRFGFRGGQGRDIELSYYTPATARATMAVETAGDYVVRLNLRANERYVDNQFDENRCEFRFEVDGDEVLNREFVRQGGKQFRFDFARKLAPGEHVLTANVRPLSDKPQIRNLRLRIDSVELIGPDDPQHFVKPAGYTTFFPRDVPMDQMGRREYARELLESFATRAFRRPVATHELDGLVSLAETVSANGATFEQGVARAMTAAIASPQFLFREERTIGGNGEAFPLIDEYSLASRLSYFLWSSMPDEELIGLASKGQLRTNLRPQIDRMLLDEKAEAFFQNFVGQWLRARAIDSVQINARAVLNREPPIADHQRQAMRERFFELFRKDTKRTPQEEQELERLRAAIRRRPGSQGPRFALTTDVRRAMRSETELLFTHIVRNNRSLLEILDSDYTFLNEALADHYEIKGVANIRGSEMRRVQLPAGSVRGGVLTQGTVLAVTSNPDRTSPVKRGLFVLENLLGTPPPAPPANIPPLEEVQDASEEKLTLRETLAIHRSNALCSSCHNRMDPLGLALENFNALGRFRDVEQDQKIDAAGTLATGEEFAGVRELKRILVANHKTAFYRCITEKLMTYALGRAVEYTDAHTVDELVRTLNDNEGRPVSLIRGIIQSSAFQRTRRRAPVTAHRQR